jgi:hypothetical protein
VSYIVRRNMPQATTFEEYFALPIARRQEMRRQLGAIPPALRSRVSPVTNYEGLQAPLAYALMAVPERLLSRVPLPQRVLWLRVLAAIAAALLLLAGAGRLLSELGVAEPFQAPALFCLLSVQTIWATLAHIGNDGAAVAVSVWAVVALVRYWKLPGLRIAAAAALLLVAGLLTKAHFLAVAPALPILCVVRRRARDLIVALVIMSALAGPWYARNLVRYHDLSGTMESRGGVGPRQVAAVAVKLPWFRVADNTLRSSLWSGNNSFVSFSGITMRLIIGLWAAALLLGMRGRHGPAEWVTWLYCALFWVAIAYATVADNITSGGANLEPRPWYAQVIAAPMLCLAFLGLSRARRAGQALAAGLVLLFAYVLASTYAVKLIPLYGGYEGRTSLAALFGLYSRHLSFLTANLNSVAMAPAWAIYAGAVLVIALAAVLVAQTSRSVHSPNPRRESAAAESAPR